MKTKNEKMKRKTDILRKKKERNHFSLKKINHIERKKEKKIDH